MKHNKIFKTANLSLLVLLLAFASFASAQTTVATKAKSFPSAQDAANALIDAAEKYDEAALVELAAEYGYTGLPSTDEAELASWFNRGAKRNDLVLYLETFAHTVGVMQHRDAIERVAYECAADLAADGVVYAEVRFAPELHTEAIYDEPYVLICRDDHPMSRRRKAEWRDVDGQSVIALGHGSANGIILNRMFTELGLNIHALHETQRSTTALA